MSVGVGAVSMNAIVDMHRHCLFKMMNQEKLIELVREYTFLYDLSDRRYSDNQRKDDAWKEIAKKLQVRDCDCKKTWALLRDAFRRAIKKRKETKSGQASVSRKKWKYEDEMSFLLPYFKERPTIGNVPANHTDKNSDAEENCSDEDNQARSSSPEAIIAHSISPPKRPNITEATVTQPSTSKKKHSISGPSQNCAPVQNRTKIRKKIISRPISSETPSNTLMKFILENKAKTNDIQQFFDSIATTVQSFPPRNRAIAKAKVFRVISEMELDILGRDSSTHSEYIGSPASYETQIPEQRNDFYNTPSPHSPSPGSVQWNNISNDESELQGVNNIQEPEIRRQDNIQETTPEYSLQHYFTTYVPE
ncbi:transcription factor Adf-1-like [Centruroides sculpturatus]|uniref:transcription factor Adf-1-like n=1 Tax=Centruroides sculpturatus TaxID=218467 RepID=UPI000C6DC143|nr:transcription factor Adf-1-like [Centruroides sculpturatus]